LNPSDFFTLVPSFTNGAKALHDELIGAALVLAFAGLLVHVALALVRKDTAHMMPTLVRLAVISIVIGSLPSWADMLVGGVNALISEMGASGAGGNIFLDYQAAIARKMGTAAAADNSSHVPSRAGQAVPSPLPGPTSQPGSGPILTHYAYPGDDGGTPGGKIDSNSARGIGAFEWDSAPGSLIPMYSAALTASAAQQYGLTPGQTFSITSGGQTYNLLYADVAPESDSRIDIYDPNGTLPGGNSFSQTVDSVNGGPVIQGQTGLSSMLPNPGGTMGDQLMWAITLALSWIAAAVMWLMQIAQQLLYLIEVAISPAFIAMLMIPALSHLAKRFFMTLASICLWPLAWAICDLVTKFLIDLAVNPAGSTNLAIANGAALVMGPLGAMAYLLVVAIWVIGSTLFAPVFISILLAAGGAGPTAAIFGATIGAAANQGAVAGWRGIGGAAGVARLAGGTSPGGASPRNASLMYGSFNYARRPMNSETKRDP
jgi:hypothetical protein